MRWETTSAFVHPVGQARTVRVILEAAKLPHAKMTPSASIFSKTISVCVLQEQTENNAKQHLNDA